MASKPCGHFIFYKKQPPDKAPERFNNPFYYEPHPLALEAARQVQEDLLSKPEVQRLFDLDGNRPGKMFGVLVVEGPKKQIGFLTAYSGKLESGKTMTPFVSPVYDIRDEKGFFPEEEREISQLNFLLENMQQDQTLAGLEKKILSLQEAQIREITELKQQIQSAKIRRDVIRAESDNPDLLRQLDEQSKMEQLLLKERKKYWNKTIEAAQSEKLPFLEKIQGIQVLRKEKSAALQHKIFDHFTFLNALGEQRSLLEIFHGIPPAGAGECAAPKLLHYAYHMGYKPLCIAEFWWGPAPAAELRRQSNFYPACKSRCEPILAHMLQGLDVEQNALLLNKYRATTLESIYEDDYLLAIHKPSGLLSVPGKLPLDSVFSLLQEQRSDLKPYMIHRLDMSTSGILLIAKDRETYKAMQRLFETRKVQKRYVAVLEGIPAESRGEINLPLRLDIEDRPRQMVCFEHGKASRTIFQQIAIEGQFSRVHFFPLTGRTHQLRVHAAHPMGLHCPIAGDDLYGQKADRLYLHADLLQFEHPVYTKSICIRCEAPF